MHVWLASQHKTFYSEVIKQIVRWRTKCIVKQGDCVEKLCSCKISALVFVNMKHTVRIIIHSHSYSLKNCVTRNYDATDRQINVLELILKFPVMSIGGHWFQKINCLTIR